MEQPATNRLQFSFTGTAREYFGIWIVNLLLSIVTVGIYTAWAKVRRLRYFYGNTWLDGHNFEYHARPLQILIGRVIVVGYLIVANILGEVSPFLSAILFVPYLLALPWIINKAIAFNAKMTSYRNIHFSFQGTYLKALGIFIGLPLLAIAPLVLVGVFIGFMEQEAGSALDPVFSLLLLLGLVAMIVLIPIVTRAGANYIGNNTSLGSARFSTDMPLRPIYGNLFASFGFTILALAVLFALIFSVGLLSGTLDSLDVTDLEENPLANLGLIAIFFLIGVLIYTPFILAYLFYRAGNRNIAFNNTLLDGKHRLVSNLSRLRYLWIIITNAVLTIVSVALLRPWAAVRTWRYLSGATAVEAQGGLNELIAGQEREGNVIAAEYLDLDGIDFGL